MSLIQQKKLEVIRNWLGTGSMNFFGRPFAGKDTHAARLKDQLGIGHVISSGEVLRASNLPEEIRAIMNQGGLPDSNYYEKILLPYISQNIFKKEPLLLCSVGRLLSEQTGVIQATTAAGHPIKIVPYLHISEAEAKRRLLQQPSRDRADDHPEVLENRLKEFTEKTTPVLQKYEALGLLVRIDAMADEITTFNNLVDGIYEHITSQ